MNLTLPPRPSLKQLKRQAKEVLKAFRARDSSCLALVKRLRQCADLSADATFEVELSLNDIQLALALYYGYDGWTNLKRHIESLKAEARAPTLSRDADAVCIRGLERMDWGGSFYRRQDSYMAVLTAYLRCAGFDTSFEEVMGLSGGAFSLQVRDPLEPSAGRVTEECIERAWRAYGLSSKRMALDRGENEAGVARLREVVTDCIDKGVPVPYMDGEYSLIVGYRGDGTQYLCMPYAGTDDGYREMEFPRGMLGPAWWADLISANEPPLARATAITESLNAALQQAEVVRASYDLWIDQLESPREPVTPVHLHGNAYCYAVLLTMRTAAADFLESVSMEYTDKVAEELASAAALYRSVSERLLAGRDCTATPRKEDWTAGKRLAEAQILRDSLADERSAFRHLERALSAMAHD